MQREGECRTRGPASAASGAAGGLQLCLLTFCAGAMILGVPCPAEPTLPRWAARAGFVAAVVLAPVVWRTWRRRGGQCWRMLAAFALGLAWSGLANDRALAARIDTPPQGALVNVTGRVVSDPIAIPSGRGVPARRFEARIAGGSGPIAVQGAVVRLSWYGGPPVARGERWQWTALLKRPWGYADPGGFDYERWLLGAGVQGTGYVRAGQRLEAATPGPLQRARKRLTTLIEGLHLANGGVLLALLVGQTSGISDAIWRTLRATGTVHLMVISGLHVSLAAALGFALARWLGRLAPWLPLWVDVTTSGCAGGAAAATAYVLLAGAGLPALRALMMSAATLALLARGRSSRLGSALLVALAVSLLMDPLAVHQQGFWLSFGAVAILYVALGHRYGEGRLRTLLRAQISLSLGMLPLVAMSTATLPWTGVPANLLAVPVMSLVVVPATLLGGCLAAVSTTVAGWVFMGADLAAGAVLAWLRWLAQAPLPLAPGGALALTLAQAGAVCWLLGAPRRYLPALLLGWALPLGVQPRGLRPGEYRVMALDVGQGSAVAVDTSRHRLLYDAGPGYPSGFETGSAVVVPSLVATGPPRLDLLILSHDDRDHTGGARAVRELLAPQTVIGPPGTSGGPSQRCSPRRWRWDGVDFRLVGANRPPQPSDNDSSCILLVGDGRHSMLIAGDISARVEANLLRVLAVREAPVHLLFAPHHGSRTSSSMAFVRVMHPRLVMVSAGRGNRFGHPDARVVARYRAIGAEVFQTGVQGALSWSSRHPQRVIRWREQRGPYWRGRDSRR